MITHPTTNGKVTSNFEVTNKEISGDRLSQISFQVYPNTNGKTQDKTEIHKKCMSLRGLAAKGKHTFATHTGIANLIYTLNTGKSVHFCITNKSCKAVDVEYVDTCFGDYDGWSKDTNSPKEGVATLEELRNLPTIKQYCAFFQKSSSYREEAPNCHFQFVYDKSLGFPDHSLVLKEIVLRLNGELKEIGKAEFFDNCVEGNSTHLCYVGKHDCEYIVRTSESEKDFGELINTDNFKTKAVEHGLTPFGLKTDKKEAVEPKESATKKSNDSGVCEQPKVAVERISGDSRPSEYIYGQLIEKFGGDYRRFFDLIDHQWQKTTRSLPEGAVGQYDGLNPFSSSNSSGTSFSITAFDVNLPPVYYDRSNNLDGDLIDYFYRFGRTKGKYQHGGSQANFKSIVNEICDHFEIPQFDWKKKKNNEEDDTNIWSYYADMLLETFGEPGIRLNMMTLQIELLGEKIKFDSIRSHLARKYGLIFNKKEIFEEVIKDIVNDKKNQYHPVKEYLDFCLEKYPVYDPSVLDGLSKKYFATTESIHDTYVRKTLIAAVARVMEPGIDFKMMLTLVGAQDAGKSLWIKRLGGVDWVNASVNISNLSDKDDKLIVNKYWIHEIGEIDRIVRKADRGSLKHFLSDTSDNFRPPYGRDTESHPRTSLFIASTNETSILNDPSGNTRFWCIPIATKSIDFELVTAERDKLWAMAFHAYKLNPRSFYLSKDEVILRDQSNEDFETEDAIQDIILPMALAKHQITIAELMIACQLKIEDKGLQNRVADILKKAGFSKKRIRVDGKLNSVWFNPNPILSDNSDIQAGEF